MAWRKILMIRQKRGIYYNSSVHSAISLKPHPQSRTDQIHVSILTHHDSGCGWGVEQSSSNLKVGSSIPSLPILHAEVSLGKMLNPEFPLIEQQSAANRCTVWMCVRMGECKKQYCKELWVVIKTRKALYKYKTIYSANCWQQEVTCFILWS